MKKIFQLIVALLILVVGSSCAFAYADKTTMQEGADITGIHRLAIAQPLYIQRKEKAPTNQTLAKLMQEASKRSKTYIVSYNTVADGINSVKSVDILALDRRTAKKIFKENVQDYADAYVELTVANDSRTTFFFDVYETGTNKLLYTYQMEAGRNDQDDEDNYKFYCESFFKQFDREIRDQKKEHERAAKKAQREAEKAQREAQR